MIFVLVMNEDGQEIRREEILEIISHKKDIHESLASDALTLLSVELVFFSIVIPLTSSVVSYKGGQITLKSQIQMQYLFYGLFSGMLSVSFTFLSYFIARQKATNVPNALFDYPDISLEPSEKRRNAI